MDNAGAVRGIKHIGNAAQDMNNAARRERIGAL